MEEKISLLESFVEKSGVFDDYSKYAAGRFDAEAKRKRHEEVFPEDCRKAYELGKKLAQQVHFGS